MGEAVRHSRELLAEGRHQENLEFLEKARERHPGEAEIQLLYATALLDTCPDEVASETKKAVELGSDDPIILVRAASLLLGRGEHQAARSCVGRARKLADPNFVLEGGLLNLEGNFAAFDENYIEAEEKMKAAMDIDPDFESFARDLARLLQVRGRETEALEVIDRALPQVKFKADLEGLRSRIASEKDLGA